MNKRIITLSLMGLLTLGTLTGCSDVKAEKVTTDGQTKEVIVKMKAGEGGRAFGSVSTKEIAAAFKEQCNVTIDKKKIQLDEAIKNFGVYKVNIKLHPKVTGVLTVKVQEL